MSKMCKNDFFCATNVQQKRTMIKKVKKWDDFVYNKCITNREKLISGIS